MFCWKPIAPDDMAAPGPEKNPREGSAYECSPFDGICRANEGM